MKNSIDHILDKIKTRAAEILDRRDVWACLLAVCAGVAGVFLGFAWAGEAKRPSVQIERLAPLDTVCPQESVASEAPEAYVQETKGRFVASKSGSKYYLPSCSGAKSISEANKIWFSSREEAERAGFSPSSSCKGI